MTRTRIASLAVALLVALPALAQEPQLLILGTAHLNNPGHDMANMQVDDVLTPKRQAEIIDIVDHLARFKPNRVALECDPKQQPDFDMRYADYRAGKYTLTRNEREQIGFRLAAKMNLPRVDCVDFQDGPPGPDDAYDFPKYAAAHGQQKDFDDLMAFGKAVVSEQTAYLQSHALIDWYRRANLPERLAADNAIYYQFAHMGGNDAHPGANWVGGWHARNLIIVENIRRMAQPGDRVFTLFGAGHAYLLHAFAVDSGAFTIIDTEKVLAQ